MSQGFYAKSLFFAQVAITRWPVSSFRTGVSFAPIAHRRRSTNDGTTNGFRSKKQIEKHEKAKKREMERLAAEREAEVRRETEARAAATRREEEAKRQAEERVAREKLERQRQEEALLIAEKKRQEQQPRLIACPVCGNQASSAAAACPKCGHPLAQQQMNVPILRSTIPTINRVAGIYRTPSGKIALFVFVIILALIGEYVYTKSKEDQYRDSVTGSSAVQSPSATKPRSAAERKQRPDVLDDMIHEFERTDGGQWLSRENIQAFIFVVTRTIPENRQAEALSDLKFIAQVSPTLWFNIKHKHLPDVRAIKQAPLMTGWNNPVEIIEEMDELTTFNYLDSIPKGARDTLQQFLMNYHSMAKDFKLRGTTVEAEAKKALEE